MTNPEKEDICLFILVLKSGVMVILPETSLFNTAHFCITDWQGRPNASPTLALSAQSSRGCGGVL